MFAVISFAGIASAAPCPEGSVQAGLLCRDAAWIQDNLAGRDDRLLAFGSCRTEGTDLTSGLIGEHCMMWFSEKKPDSSGRTLVAQIHLLSGASCNGGDNCVGGFARLARLQLDTFTVDYNGQAAGVLRIASAKAGSNASPVGTIRWTVTSSSIEMDVTDAAKNFVWGARVDDSPFYFGDKSCATTVASLESNGGKDTMIYSSFTDAVEALAAAESSARSASVRGRSRSATFAPISGNVARAVGETIGVWADDILLCGGVTIR